jgi:hypothetical protein
MEVVTVVQGMLRVWGIPGMAEREMLTALVKPESVEVMVQTDPGKSVSYSMLAPQTDLVEVMRYGAVPPACNHRAETPKVLSEGQNSDSAMHYLFAPTNPMTCGYRLDPEVFRILSLQTSGHESKDNV